MEPYFDTGGDSGVVAYVCGAEFIRVQFKDGRIYRYTYESAGRGHVEEMKRLAAAGEGLNSYIVRHVRKAYARRER